MRVRSARFSNSNMSSQCTLPDQRDFYVGTLLSTRAPHEPLTTLFEGSFTQGLLEKKGLFLFMPVRRLCSTLSNSTYNVVHSGGSVGGFLDSWLLGTHKTSHSGTYFLLSLPTDLLWQSLYIQDNYQRLHLWLLVGLSSACCCSDTHVQERRMRI